MYEQFLWVNYFVGCCARWLDGLRVGPGGIVCTYLQKGAWEMGFGMPLFRELQAMEDMLARIRRWRTCESSWHELNSLYHLFCGGDGIETTFLLPLYPKRIAQQNCAMLYKSCPIRPYDRSRETVTRCYLQCTLQIKSCTFIMTWMPQGQCLVMFPCWLLVQFCGIIFGLYSLKMNKPLSVRRSACMLDYCPPEICPGGTGCVERDGG